MSITQEQIARLRALSALNTKKEIDIDAVISSFDALDQVDTTGVKNITRSGNTKLLLREDTVKPSPYSAQMLACSPQRVAACQIILKGIMHGE
ncbi:hypothetical protein CSB09_01265 [Candidatus Gracilibacteria bacterium]|nr:MAG: hypothetical protein CSB09_01265 [Candidatus Gracilibacteria bacterium]